VLLGCFSIVAGVVIMAFLIIVLVGYMESGADRGTVTLRIAESYPPGSYEYIGTENLYIVRLIDGRFLALTDLDAANAANQSRRCRVAPVIPGDPAFLAMHEQYQRRVQREVTGTTVYLREACNNAIYDLTGTRLDANGPNLDRLAVEEDQQGRIVVDTRDRECSRRDEDGARSAC
jgi:hypothetical protein